MRSLHAHPEQRSEDFAQHSTCTADHIEAGMCGVGWGDGFQHPGPLLPGRASSNRGCFSILTYIPLVLIAICCSCKHYSSSSEAL